MTPTQSSLGGLSAITFTNLRDQVVKMLRESIILGQLEPGSPLGETRLAKTLNVSRGTVREAILELEKESLVETSSSGKHRVIELKAKTVADVFHVRGTLEGLAARTIQQSPDRAKKQELLRKMLDTFDQPSDNPIIELIDADLDFHRTLCEMSENKYLLDSWKAIEGPLRVAIVYAGNDLARTNMMRSEHQPFIDALDAGQKDPAGLVYQTLVTTAQGLIDSYNSSKD